MSENLQLSALVILAIALVVTAVVAIIRIAIVIVTIFNHEQAFPFRFITREYSLKCPRQSLTSPFFCHHARANAADPDRWPTAGGWQAQPVPDLVIEIQCSLAPAKARTFHFKSFTFSGETYNSDTLEPTNYLEITFKS